MKNRKINKVFNALTMTAYLGVAAGIVGLGVGGIIGHVDTQDTTQTLQAMGYHDVKISGKGSFFDCTRDRKWYRTDFSAVNANGIKQTGTACKGFIVFPATTIKLNN